LSSASGRLSSVPGTKDTIHYHKSVLLAFHFFRRKDDSCLFGAKRHDKENLYLIMDEQAGGTRAKPIYGGVSEWSCTVVFF